MLEGMGADLSSELPTEGKLVGAKELVNLVKKFSSDVTRLIGILEQADPVVADIKHQQICLRNTIEVLRDDIRVLRLKIEDLQEKVAMQSQPTEELANDAKLQQTMEQLTLLNAKSDALQAELQQLPNLVVGTLGRACSGGDGNGRDGGGGGGDGGDGGGSRGGRESLSKAAKKA